MFAHKNISVARNVAYTSCMVLLVLVSAAQNGHSVNSASHSPNADSVFYRIDTSIRRLESQFWQQGLSFLRRKKRKLLRVKCYVTVDETYDSYTGNLHKKPIEQLSAQQKTTRKYIHFYKPKDGDTGSFKYLVFALIYGNKRRVLRVKSLRRGEPYWLFVAQTLQQIHQEVSFECALLDRGFYVSELVDKLQKMNVPFIIRARVCETMKKAYGIYSVWKQYAYDIAGTVTTKLILGKDIRENDWGFVTNTSFVNLEDCRFIYKKRWNIENIFKATDGIQLRVATNNHVTRLFAVCLSFTIYNAWQKRNKKPTLLEHTKQLFKTILKIILRLRSHTDVFKLNTPLWEFITNS